MGVDRAFGIGSRGKAGLLAIASVVCVAAGDPTPSPRAEPYDALAINRHDAPVPDDGGASQGGGAVSFRGFDNFPLGQAILTIDGVLDDLVVSNLTVTSAAAAAASVCTAPASGGEICLAPVKQTAGDRGVRVEKVSTRIPNDVTSYYVQVEEYWGSTITDPDWETNPMPVGFRTSGGSIIGCADFDQCPIYCDDVEVEFSGGRSPGKIECPAGDLFSISSSTTIKLQRIKLRGLCPGGGCSEAAAKAQTRLEFHLGAIVSGFTAQPGCTVTAGSGPFTARRIYVRPVRSSCMEAADDCTPATSCGIGGPPPGGAALGGTTPPILSIKLLAQTATLATAASVEGTFRIEDEAICTLSETGACGDGYDNDCDDLVDLLDPECPPNDIPAMSTWGVAVLALVLCTAAVLFLRRPTGDAVRA
jgi:hypothetical protein